MNIWPVIFVIGHGDSPRREALMLATAIRSAVFEKRCSLQIQPVPSVEVCVDANLKKQLEKANKRNATHVVMMRDGETSAMKDMVTGEQREMPSAWIADEFCRLMEERYL
jgi:histidyl-tRNA synthetase